MAGSRLIGVATSRYLRTWPPQAGNVTFSVTIDPPPGLEEAVGTLLREVGWEGIFELELIQDERGTITPIDLNPRPYGSMALAIASGANLPGLWCDWVLDRDHQPVVENGAARAQPGRHYQWEDADLRHFLWQVRHRHWRAAAKALRPSCGVVHAHFRLTDPLPLLARALFLAVGKIRARVFGLPA